MPEVSNLEPKIVWKHFAKILTIPRPSGKEEQMRQYIKDFAQENKLEYRQDDFGNVVVAKSASVGKENVPIVVLQSHLDMVCEKDRDCPHDFDKDPIKTQIKGDYLYAVNTTLGADNGMGVAACLAVLEDSNLVHGPIECLFTMEEEVGLVGAKKLNPQIVKGKRLINLDSEEDGVIYIGCAGGGDTVLNLAVETQALPKGYKCVEITISGLKGGHSGCDIHIGRANSVKLLARFLWDLKDRYSLYLQEITGGDKHNAIPRNASALVAIPDSKFAQCSEEVQKALKQFKSEYGEIEPQMSMHISEVDAFNKVLQEESMAKVLGLLKVIPHGVLAMNASIAGMVDTSNNLAKVAFEKNTCSINTSSRSSFDNALESVRQSIAAAGVLAGAKIEQDEPYPGWSPDTTSTIVQVAKKSYAKTYGREPEVKTIHAGLECGAIGEKIPDMDMVSIGPQIENPHSPEERVHIESVNVFWKALTAMLVNLAE